MGKLNDLKIKRLVPGFHADGDNLYLQVTASGSRTWVFRYTLNKVPRYMGLGSFKYVTLADARLKANDCKRLLIQGKDPLGQKQLSKFNAMSFDECFEKFFEGKKNQLGNPKHIQQWQSSIKTYASPILGKMPVASIDVAIVVKVLEPIWTTKTETASRVRGRIEDVLDWAFVMKLRTGENPARWSGILDKVLPNPSDLKSEKHFEAMPHTEIPVFLTKLRLQNGFAPLALEFLICTAVRTDAVIGAKWPEIDFETKIWTVPPERMKNKKNKKKSFRVPLTEKAIELLNKAKINADNEFIFAGWKEGTHLSNTAMLSVLRKRMGINKITSHGFRSSFRNWASERTNFSREVIEFSLSHVVRNKTEAAYLRSDLLEKRRELMNAWSDYCQEITLSHNKIMLASA